MLLSLLKLKAHFQLMHVYVNLLLIYKEPTVHTLD